MPTLPPCIKTSLSAVLTATIDLNGGVAFPEASRAAAASADAVLMGSVGDPAFDHLPPMERPQRCLLDLRQPSTPGPTYAPPA